MSTQWTNERVERVLAAQNPLPTGELEGLERSPEALQLLEQILHADAGEEVHGSPLGDHGGPRRGPLAGRTRRAFAPPRWPRLLVAAVVALVVAAGIAVPLAVAPGGGLRGPTISAFHASTPFTPASTARSPTGRWRLLDAALTGRWQQNAAGPPPGRLTCADVHACYLMAGKYASPDANAPLLSESLYATSNLGTTWSEVPMPAGFQPTSPLSCPSEGTCAVGGTTRGSAVLLVTTDGGSRWTTVPVHGISGDLVELACFSATACDGVAGPSWASAEHPGGNLLSTPSATLDETFVTTADGGGTWSATSLSASADVEDFSCAGPAHCLVMGRQATTSAGSPTEADFVRVTSDGGQTWTAGSLPEGFMIGPISALSCADAEHCFLSGMVPITIANPPRCSTVGGVQRTSSTPASLPSMSPSVAAISQTESRLWTSAMLAEAKGGLVSCTGGSGTGSVSDIASTSDGGLTWTPDALPSNVPDPSLGDIACASATTCWASGSEAVLQKVGTALDGGSPVLLGTTDGGTTWSKVVFSVPAGAPNPYGQSYLSMGDLECPQPNACIALGAAAQSSPTAPVYRFVSSPG